VYFPRIPAVELELENDFFNGLLRRLVVRFSGGAGLIAGPALTFLLLFDRVGQAFQPDVRLESLTYAGLWLLAGSVIENKNEKAKEPMILCLGWALGTAAQRSFFGGQRMNV
jgi:hypothetical protein